MCLEGGGRRPPLNSPLYQRRFVGPRHRLQGTPLHSRASSSILRLTCFSSHRAKCAKVAKWNKQPKNPAQSANALGSGCEKTTRDKNKRSRLSQGGNPFSKARRLRAPFKIPRPSGASRRLGPRAKTRLFAPTSSAQPFPACIRAHKNRPR